MEVRTNHAPPPLPPSETLDYSYFPTSRYPSGSCDFRDNRAGPHILNSGSISMSTYFPRGGLMKINGKFDISRRTGNYVQGEWNTKHEQWKTLNISGYATCGGVPNGRGLNACGNLLRGNTYVLLRFCKKVIVSESNYEQNTDLGGARARFSSFGSEEWGSGSTHI